MSTSASEGTDDLIVHLMSMGFELTDCQDAVAFGKISVEAAVEWLIAGKPGFKSQQTQQQGGPSLKLRQTTSTFDTASSAFSKPVPLDESLSASIPQASSPQSQSSINEPHANQSSNNKSEPSLVSRMHLTDSQRKQKEGFEQKKRDEAKRKAMLEKKRQKEDHDRVLKEIAADREKKKLLQTANKEKTEVDPPPVKEQKLETDTAKASTSTQPANSLLLFRLPDGRSLRQSFDSSAKLQEVREFIRGQQSDLTGYTLIQPFPHHEFTEQEMSSTLHELKLAPSGSIVLQKKQVTQRTITEPCNETAAMDEDDVVPLAPRQPISGPTAIPPSPTGPNNNYVWGQGNALNEEEAANNDIGEMEREAEGAEEEMEREIDEAEMMAGMGLPAQFVGGQGRGRGGGGFNLPPPGQFMAPDVFGMPGDYGQQQAFSGVGQRLVSEAENPAAAPGEAAGLRMARERALQRAEAIQARLAQNNPDPEPNSPSHLQVTSSVPRLLTLCSKHIAHRLNDPRNQLLSLGGISEDMAQIILTYLLKEKLLKPRTLNPFIPWNQLLSLGGISEDMAQIILTYLLKEKLLKPRTFNPFIPCYLRQLILDTYPYATNELLHAVRLHRNLSHLSISSCPLITDAGFQDLSGMKKLRQLNLSGCRQLTNRCAEVLCSLSSLVSLNLEETGFGDSGVIQYLSSNPEHLTSLNLNRTAVTHAIISHLHTRATNLRQLSLENTQVESLLGIDQLPHLESLNVARTGILPESLLCLVQCPALISLNIANTEKIPGDTALQNLRDLKLQTLGLPSRHTTTDIGVAFLTSFQLHSLDLTNYIFITDAGIEHIGKITSLRKLLLGNTKITDEGLVFLGGLSRLEVLDLERTLITDTGALVLRELKTLVEVSLASTKITSRCLLQGALNSCVNLMKLNLSKTSITSRGVQALNLPFLEIINLDGTKVKPDLTVATMTQCPALNQIMMRNLVPYTRQDEEEEMELDS